MEELDLLKKDWKKSDHTFKEVSENEIYTMLHRRSSSIVKWILVIGIIEVLVWSGIGLIFSTDDYLKKMEHNSFVTGVRVFNYINYAIVLIFMYLFYRNYVNISATSSTRKLMKDIIKTRKTVQYYVWFNLAVIAISLVLGFFMAVSYNPEISGLREQINHDGAAMAKFLGLIFLIILVCVAVFWAIYRLIYGILLRRLLYNYRELKKIDL